MIMACDVTCITVVLMVERSTKWKLSCSKLCCSYFDDADGVVTLMMMLMVL